MEKTTVIDLVFEGGGLKGVAFIGALRALYNYGYRPGRLLGTSIGSMFASLIAAGYSADELQDRIFDSQSGESRLPQYIKPFPPIDSTQIDASATRRLLERLDLRNLPDFLEGSLDNVLAHRLMGLPSLRGLFTFIENCGTNNPEPFVKWLEELIAVKINTRSDVSSSAMTLAQFHQVTGRWLSLIAADVTNPTMLILNHITAPDCPVVQAIRMSTAAPIFFPPVIWKAEWGLYRNQELTGDIIVDGAILSNFPIELLLSTHQAVTDMMGKPDENTSVLGLLLDESIAVPGAPKVEIPRGQLLLDELPGITLIGKIIRTAIDARDKRAIEAASELIVRLPVMGYPLDAFQLTPRQLQPLLNSGYNAMVAHLETHQDPSGIAAITESARSQWDSKAMYTINVNGNFYQVTQNVGVNTGKVIGISNDTGSEK
jgi:NTE family protein